MSRRARKAIRDINRMGKESCKQIEKLGEASLKASQRQRAADGRPPTRLGRANATTSEVMTIAQGIAAIAAAAVSLVESYHALRPRSVQEQTQEVQST